jgi:hypothetical protein
MKHLLWGKAGALLLLGAGVVFAVGALELASKPKPGLPGLLPEGALLYLEARDFGSLLQDWNTSEEKRAWLISDNHAAFSTSRLFGRLSQAQDEFSAAAGIPADTNLLTKVAGKESCLGLYDIGNLEFVYVTRLRQQEIENTPLWQTRGKFEQRNEAGTAFYVHKYAQSSRTAAFAAKDGWLILGTREDLVAGVLDRLQGTSSHSLSDEGWYVEAVRQASAAHGDLRMVLNLDKIVPSPYFRSYWIERNITEMKQYASAVSDLYRTPESYRDERVLVRRAGLAARAAGDVSALSALAPEDAAFYAAQASPSLEGVLSSLRQNLLDYKPGQTLEWSADSAASYDNAGSSSQFDIPIDRAPVAVQQADAFQSLRTLLRVQQPDAQLNVFTTRAPRDGVFVSLQTAMALTAPQAWDEDSVCQALSAALLPGLTAGAIGAHWETRSSAAGQYLALDGAVSLFVRVDGKQLLLANDRLLLEKMLARRLKAAPAGENSPVTYVTQFRSTQEQNNFRLLMTQLDSSAHRSGGDQQESGTNGQAPAFFSGNVMSFSRVFSRMQQERIEERDMGGKVTQTVTYQWAR